ncbi:MAG: hypothetical protein AB7D06_13270 [Pedobacter sp.]
MRRWQLFGAKLNGSVWSATLMLMLALLWGAPQTAFAGDSDLPPAIANSKDAGIKKAYLWTITGNYTDARVVLMGGRVSGTSIQMQSFYEDPAVMITIMTYNITAGRSMQIDLGTDAPWDQKKLEEQYPAQYNFLLGFSGFLAIHKEHNRKIGYSEIEKDLLKSISYAAYPDKQLAMQKYALYQGTTTLDEKIKFVDEILKRAEQSDFVHQRWIANSTAWLVNHYWLTAKKDNDPTHQLMRLFADHLEKPLDKLDKGLIVRDREGTKRYLNKYM